LAESLRAQIEENRSQGTTRSEMMATSLNFGIDNDEEQKRQRAQRKKELIRQYLEMQVAEKKAM
jgi:hypothetical protein